jgi:RNA polymerase sigma-70 factor (ECF subfamily)
MWDDRRLVWKLKRGSREALRQIYEAHKNDLLALAMSLGPDRATAEDAVHDVFISLVQFAPRLRLRGSLKGYLFTFVANRIRNLGKQRGQQLQSLDQVEMACDPSEHPEQLVMSFEESRQIGRSLAQLPYEQREVIVLHLQGGLRFKRIAQEQDVSINTVQSRYRYGLDKLRSLLKGQGET